MDMTLDTLDIPGPPPFVRVARDVLDVVFTVDPSIAANAGLFTDGVRVPSYTPAAIATNVRRLDHDLDLLTALPWRNWDVDTQIDVRLVYSAAATTRHQLVEERRHQHRPGQWLEPVANTLIALASYAPERVDLQDQVLAGLPALLAEIPAQCTGPTRRDLDTSRELGAALRGIAVARGATLAVAALDQFAAWVENQKPDREFAVVGPDSYAWRFQHALLLPWTPAELLSRAQASLLAVDERLASLPPRSPPPAPTAAQVESARRLDRAGLLGLYDAVSRANRAATERGGWVTIPPTVGDLRARETPDVLVPLTGDGGSMNPPPTFGGDSTGYWNVEHFRADRPEQERVDTIVRFDNFRSNGMGPYSAHEGFPGHFLQLAIARTHPDPLRSILADPVQNEGWGLYAEEVFFEHGGLDGGPDAERSYLGAFRSRIARVVYDVRIETGVWTLQEAADFKYQAATPGAGKVDEDLLRSINWPTQLICYYSGKTQILELREAWRKKMGPSYSDRAFHDAFLAEGSIPIALIRAKMMGEPVPGFPSGGPPGKATKGR